MPSTVEVLRAYVAGTLTTLFDLPVVCFLSRCQKKGHRARYITIFKTKQNCVTKQHGKLACLTSINYTGTCIRRCTFYFRVFYDALAQLRSYFCEHTVEGVNDMENNSSMETAYELLTCCYKCEPLV